MNKNLKIGLILGSTALVLGTVIYFATRKTDEEAATEGGEEKSGEENKSENSEEKKTSDNKPKSSRPKSKQTASKGGTSSATTTKQTTATKPTATVNLKGSNVSGVISKTQNPAIYKGKVVISSKDKTILMGAKGNKLYELKRGTTVGKIVSSSLTKTGDYLITVQMNNGKSVLVNGNNLNFA
jgi:hypothetical protein